MKDMYSYVTAGAAVTSPAWIDFMSHIWQTMVPLMGAIVLALTIWNKILENRQRRRDLRSNP